MALILKTSLIAMKRIKFNILLKIIIIASSIFTSIFSYAQCQLSASSASLNNHVSFGKVIVPRDLPIAAEIASSTVNGSSDLLGPCTLYFDLTYANGVKTSVPQTYKTNVDGVGVSVSYLSGPTSISTQHPAEGMYLAAYQTISITGATVKLVKTGPIKSGSLSSGEVSELRTDTNFIDYKIFIDGGEITSNSCSLSTSSLTFNMGTIAADSFGISPGFVHPATQTENIKMDCDAGTNVNITLQGAQSQDTNTPGVLALDSQGQGGAANGVGIQIMYGDKPLEINKMIPIKTTSGGTETFPITARYYQTKNTVTAGSANAIATLDITYQ